ELMRVVVLATVQGRIDGEVGIQAILDRDAWCHVRCVAFGSCELDGDGSGAAGQRWMSEECSAHASATTNLLEEGVHECTLMLRGCRGVGFVAAKTTHVRMHGHQLRCEARVRCIHEHHIGTLDVGADLLREVRTCGKPEPYAHQPS